MLLRCASLLFSALLLVACGDGGSSNGATTASGKDSGLPTPAGASGSVTGMPDRPGPGPVGPPAGTEPLPEAVALDADGNPILPEGVPADGSAVVEGGPGEPTVEDAVGVIREYYAAINRGDFGGAYALWSDGGRASGQSVQGFAAGFNDVTGVSVEIGAPGAVEGAAGARLVQVPVALVASQRDGGERRFAGSFTLRRTVVDGASDEQRRWRIAATDLRDATP